MSHLRTFKQLTAIIILIMVVLPAQTRAQEDQSDVQTSPDGTLQVDATIKIEDVEGLDLQLIRNTQDPGTKDIKFDLIINSRLTSDRVQVKWLVSGSSEVVQGESVINLSLSENQTVSQSITIRPREFGTTSIKAFVEAFQIDGTRIASASQLIGTYPDGEVFPPTENHELAKTLYTVRLIATVASAIMGGIVGLFIAYKLFRNWLNN